MNTTRVILQFILTATVSYLLLISILAGTVPGAMAVMGFGVLWLINRKLLAL